jgi:hypothetical protein
MRPLHSGYAEDLSECSDSRKIQVQEGDHRKRRGIWSKNRDRHRGGIYAKTLKRTGVALFERIESYS